MKDIQLLRNRPPTTWGDESNLAHDVTEINAHYGIYAQPSLDPETKNPAIWHWCRERKCWLIAGTRAHQLVANEPLHLEPSLLWGCCGMHGFIREGKWVHLGWDEIPRS
jgi:hypothetical protein